MGKRIIQRARGKGGPRYRSPGHRYEGAIKYPAAGEFIVRNIIHDAARDAPLAVGRDSIGRDILFIAAEGLAVGQKLNIGGKAESGNVVPISAVEKGSFIFGMENSPGSGPKFCCTAGTHATIVSKETGKVIVQMPSKKQLEFDPRCLVTVGIAAGGGRNDKPYVKAGQLFYATQARNTLWPRSSANKMNPVDHPFGGKTKPGTPKTISRWAPPGAKVGAVAARRSGVRKK